MKLTNGSPFQLKDACYHKVKKQYKVFPSAYASGAIAKCRKNKGKKIMRQSPLFVRKTEEGANLKRWFKEKWTDEKGNPCGSTKNKNTKKCRPSKKISSKTGRTWNEMSSTEKKKAVAEKKRVGMGNRASNIE